MKADEGLAALAGLQLLHAGYEDALIALLPKRRARLGSIRRSFILHPSSQAIASAISGSASARAVDLKLSKRSTMMVRSSSAGREPAWRATASRIRSRIADGERSLCIASSASS